MGGFYAHHFSINTALCDGGASALRFRFTFAASKGVQLQLQLHAHVVGSAGPRQHAPWLSLEVGPLVRTYIREPNQRFGQFRHILFPQCHYEHIKQRYHGNDTWCFPATDSVCNRIKTNYICVDMKETMDLHDTSNYAEDERQLL